MGEKVLGRQDVSGGVGYLEEGGGVVDFFDREVGEWGGVGLERWRGGGGGEFVGLVVVPGVELVAA